VLVTEILPGVPQEQPAVLNMTRREHNQKMTTLE
jgi:hypothetical protein